MACEIFRQYCTVHECHRMECYGRENGEEAMIEEYRVQGFNVY